MTWRNWVLLTWACVGILAVTYSHGKGSGTTRSHVPYTMVVALWVFIAYLAVTA